MFFSYLNFFAIVLLANSVNCLPANNFSTFIASDCKNYNLEKISFLSKELYSFSVRQFPSNVRELDAFHKRSTEIFKELQAYFQKCIPAGVVRMFAMRTLNDAFTELKSVSDTSTGNITEKQLNFMAFSKCYNPLVFDFSICIYSGINYVLDSFKFRQTIQKMEFICCNIPIMNDCMAQVVVNSASSFCTPNEVRDSVNYIRSYRGDPLQVLCKNFNQTDKETCSKYESFPKYEPSIPFHYFYYLPLIDSLLFKNSDDYYNPYNPQ